MTSSVETPPTKIVADPQDPLPESNWGWRRAFQIVGLIMFAVSMLMILILLGLIAKQTPTSATDVVKGLVALGVAMVVIRVIQDVFYMVAPSAEQVTKIFATLSALKSGISFHSASRVQTPDGTATTTSTATAPDPNK